MKVETLKASRCWFEERQKIYADNGRLLGEIQTIHLPMTYGCCESTVYIAMQHYRNWGVKACMTRLDAYHYLGVSTAEVDKYFESL